MSTRAVAKTKFQKRKAKSAAKRRVLRLPKKANSVKSPLKRGGVARQTGKTKICMAGKSKIRKAAPVILPTEFFVPIKVSRLLTKITALLLIGLLNWAGLSAVGNTLAYFNDIEGNQNSFQASSLDFSLSGADFSPAVTPSQNATSTIDLQKDGVMDFIYGAKTTNASGTLCAFLELEDSWAKTYRPLGSFISATTTFSASSSLIFDARLTSASKALQNKMCEFKFVFDGEQINGAGFSDSEEISRTITTGEWPSVVINKVYYDVDTAHGSDPANEWVELYNPTSQPVDVTGWKIFDNTGNDALASTTAQIIIPSLGYAIVTNASTTWNYWNIPHDVIKIELNSAIGGHGLNNDGDRVILKNLQDEEVDAMSYGGNITVFNPSIPGVPEGHMLARVPSGLDTDAVSDWQKLELPEITLIYPVGREVWYVGHEYNLQWTATNPNGLGLDSDLKIDLYYSNNSGLSWAAIATSTENDGTYNWHVPLFLDYDHYYVPSPRARIKVVATGPENFMVQAEDESDDFCPPIDYDSLSLEEQGLVDFLLRGGVIDESEVVRGGVEDEAPAPEIIAEEIGAAEEQPAEEATQAPNSGSASSGSDFSETETEETLSENENIEEAADVGEPSELETEETEETLPADETVAKVENGSEPGEEVVRADEPIVAEEAPVGDEIEISQEEPVIETPPATESEVIIAPSNNPENHDAAPDGDGGDDSSGASSAEAAPASSDSAAAAE